MDYDKVMRRKKNRRRKLLLIIILAMLLVGAFISLFSILFTNATQAAGLVNQSGLLALFV
jgi:flagellar basal body-associated protein FliL